jgi:hypothetical protein
LDSAPLRTVLRVAKALAETGLDYAVGGSIASGFYGEARATFDVDILVDLPAWRVAALVAALGPGFEVDPDALSRAARDGTSYNVIDSATGVKVDLFVMGDRPLDSRQMQRRRTIVLGESGQTAAFTSPEDVVLRKLDWLRSSGGVLERQWRDVLGVLKVQGRRLDLGYLRETARRLGLTESLDRALAESGLSG